MNRKQIDRTNLQRVISGALVQQMDAHGDIKKDHIRSAAKRCSGQVITYLTSGQPRPKNKKHAPVKVIARFIRGSLKSVSRIANDEKVDLALDTAIKRITAKLFSEYEFIERQK